MEECQKKEIISSYLIYNIVNLSKHKLLKNRTSFMNDKLTMVSCQVLRKFSYWKNLLLYWMMLTKASVRIWTLSNNDYVRKSSHPINLQTPKLHTAGSTIDWLTKAIKKTIFFEGYCVWAKEQFQPSSITKWRINIFISEEHL